MQLRKITYSAPREAAGLATSVTGLIFRQIDPVQLRFVEESGGVLLSCLEAPLKQN
jgi:hypothetical protein